MKTVIFVNQKILCLPNEIWIDAPDIVTDICISDRYEISNIGRVRNKSYEKVGRNKHGTFSFVVPSEIWSQSYDQRGYLKSHFSRKTKRTIVKRSIGTHRLVLTAFKGHPSDKEMQVNHIDGVKDNNILDNLEWLSCRDNILHSYKNELKSNRGEKHPRSMFTTEDILEIRELYEGGWSYNEISEKFSCKYATIWSVVNRVNYKEVV